MGNKKRGYSVYYKVTDLDAFLKFLKMKPEAFADEAGILKGNIYNTLYSKEGRMSKKNIDLIIKAFPGFKNEFTEIVE